ncbi:hypothetical protein FocTR4_00013697 [Fusarium oxysporum f. sp. cubense]|uniref:Uncharacterized protein n=1 Tax=Fusarium oxysporum f. sp. cubense TaxID=61366 RepID=A0A5C6SNR1_FUSOC|nr:hypothetical protein FocTR4_00013697 [Fusarium oxysporum f. sp. cubense]
MGLRDAYCPLVIASLVIDGIAVGLRLWTRSIKKAIGYDDIAMMFSLVNDLDSLDYHDRSSIAIIIRLKYLIDLSRLSLASGGLATQEAVETTLGGTIYSILEISLSILAASLTALRPLLKTLTCFRTVSFDNPHRSRAFNSMNTLGNGSYTRGTAYRLDDRNVSDADSQENIIPSGLINSRKET